MAIKFDLGEYLGDVFIATGIGRGGNIIRAVRAGFADIHGVELSPDLQAIAQAEVSKELARIPWRNNVMLYCGPSTLGLEHICGQMHEKRATILLDAWEGGGLERPLLDEIAIIRRWFQDTIIPPIIMVGGIREPRPGLQAVTDALLDLCEDYQFRILDDDTRRNILVALPPTWTRAG